MNREPLDVVPIWLLLVALCVFTGLALEGGYRLGQWRHARAQEEKATPVGAMVGSILALFAFMLAFTFGMAGSRFEARRQTVLEEANAIGATYRRTQLLHEPQRSVSAKLLREYVDVRVRGMQEGKVEEAITRSEELQEQLWVEATKAAESDPGPITALYIQSLNQMIDLHAKRVQIGIRSRIPFSIWMGLFAIALLAMASVGYQAGLSPTQRSPLMLALVLAFARVLISSRIWTAQREGFLIVSQEAMTDLQRTMNAETQRRVKRAVSVRLNGDDWQVSRPGIGEPEVPTGS